MTKRRWKHIAAALLLSSVVGGVGFLGWELANGKFPYPSASRIAAPYADALPAEFGPVRIVTYDVDPGAFETLLLAGINAQACGGVLFELDLAAVQRIAVERLEFFAKARQARAYPLGTNTGHLFSYAPWRETPWPKEWLVEGALSHGFACMDLDRESQAAITQAAKAAGNYFTRARGGELLVIPGRRLILYTFRN